MIIGDYWIYVFYSKRNATTAYAKDERLITDVEIYKLSDFKKVGGIRRFRIEHEPLGIGQAILNPNDKFSKATGRALALSRAAKNAGLFYHGNKNNTRNAELLTKKEVLERRKKRMQRNLTNG